MSAIKRLALKIKKEKEADKTASKLIIKRESNKSKNNMDLSDVNKHSDNPASILSGNLIIQRPEKTVTKQGKSGKIQRQEKTSVYKKKQPKKNSK